MTDEKDKLLKELFFIQEKIKEVKYTYDFSNSKPSLVVGFQSLEYLTEDLVQLLGE